MRKLENDLDCDILIIGCGITGALAYYKFHELGYKTIIVDKDEVGNGSTKRNTGLIQFSSDRMLHKMIKSEGAYGKRFYKECFSNVRELVQISKGFEDKSALKETKSIYLCSTNEDYYALEEEFVTLKENGYDVEELSKEELLNSYGIYKDYAIVTNQDASILPHTFANELVKGANDIYNAVFLNAKNNVAYFKGDMKIKYKYIIYATGYDTVNYKSMKGVIKNVTYAFTTKLDLKTNDVMVWETARPYIYQNRTYDGKSVIGGQDTDKVNTALKKIEGNVNKLVEEYKKWYHLEDIKMEERFGALFYSMQSGYPEYVKEEDSFYLFPYGGNGVTYSLLLINRIIQKYFSNI